METVKARDAAQKIWFTGRRYIWSMDRSFGENSKADIHFQLNNRDWQRMPATRQLVSMQANKNQAPTCIVHQVEKVDSSHGLTDIRKRRTCYGGSAAWTRRKKPAYTEAPAARDGVGERLTYDRGGRVIACVGQRRSDEMGLAAGLLAMRAHAAAALSERALGVHISGPASRRTTFLPAQLLYALKKDHANARYTLQMCATYSHLTHLRTTNSHCRRFEVVPHLTITTGERRREDEEVGGRSKERRSSIFDD
ncbi:hypothetical protein K438DRAFT_2146451 [Mycena galopus ATCC 62051]|nr:hypothetical protein K438DRAFT_2146451 [Mycena galopus ATCC 62051]